MTYEHYFRQTEMCLPVDRNLVLQEHARGHAFVLLAWDCARDNARATKPTQISRVATVQDSPHVSAGVTVRFVPSPFRDGGGFIAPSPICNSKGRDYFSDPQHGAGIKEGLGESAEAPQRF